MLILRPDQTFDPATVRVHVDASFLENLEEMCQRAIELASRNKYALIYHARVGAEDEHGQPTVRERLVIEDQDPWYFERKPIQCPREADAIAEANDDPKAFPSMLFRRRKDRLGAEAVVSRPNLCDECIHKVCRLVEGNCFGKQFERLPSTEALEGVDA